MSDQNQPNDQTPSSLPPVENKPELTDTPVPLMKTEPVIDTKVEKVDEVEKVEKDTSNMVEKPVETPDKPTTTPAAPPPVNQTPADETFTISAVSSPPINATPTQTPTKPSLSENLPPPTAITSDQPVPAADVTVSSLNQPPPKKKSPKMAGILIAILFIALTIPAAVFLVKTSQDIRQKAITPCKVCTNGSCINNPPPCIPDINQCNSNADCPKPPSPSPSPTRYKCTNSGSCISDPKGDFLSLGECRADCHPAPPPSPSPSPSPSPCTGGGTRGFTGNLQAQIKVTQCDIDQCNVRAGGNGQIYVAKYKCNTPTMPAGGCQDNGVIETWNAGVGDSFGFDTGFICGAQQVDLGCKNAANTFGSMGYMSTSQWADTCVVPPTPKPTPPEEQPSPTPPPVGAQCVAVKIYTVDQDINDPASWVLLTSEQLAQLQPGNTIYITTLGAVSNGVIDKARIRVNSAIWTPDNETTLKKPGSNEFYIIYTIPADGTTTFNFGAEIHEVNTDKWF